MTFALRCAAIAIALAAFVDPAIARRVAVPLAVEFSLPRASDPGHPRALALRKAIEQRIGTGARGGLTPDAVIAIGDADIDVARDSNVFAVPLPLERPGASIVAIDTPARTVNGQLAPVTALIRGIGTSGRTSTIALELRGSVLQRIEHKWLSDDEPFEARLSLAPPGPGVYHVRVRVTTEGTVEPAVADTVIVATSERLRVLVFEPRPSWTVAFVRRALEADPLFEVASTTRTSRPASTRTSESPRGLSDVDADRYDVLIAGALDELTDGELEHMNRFAAVRGGTVFLLPDRQIPASVRREFGLPLFEEVLLEKPQPVEGAELSLQAAELLLAPPAGSTPLATVRRADTTRAAIASVERGEGRIIVSGALDAWRYRSNPASAFGPFWRAVVGEAALAAPPRLSATIEPAIAREGDPLSVSVNVRGTEFDRGAAQISMPPIAASLVDAAGREQPLRIWPGTRVGAFAARLPAPPPGRYTVTVSMSGASTSVPLLVDDTVVHAWGRPGEANTYAARATGGAVVTDMAQLGERLARMDAGTHERTVHPMRSWWWIVPFSALLCGEWTLRRRSGLR